MSTTSTVPAAIDSLLTLLADGMAGANADVGVFETWPGPDATAEMLLLGEVKWPDYGIATIKTGRPYRDEEYTVEFEVLIFGAEGSTPSAPKPARDRAFAVLEVLDDVVTNDPTVALGTTVKWVELRLESAMPHVFETAWAYRVAGQIVGKARLT